MGNTGSRNSSIRSDEMIPMDANSDINIKQRYSIGKTVGQGVTSKVVEVTEISTGKKFALKSIEKLGPLDYVNFERETTILRKLRHPNIIA